MIHDYVFITSIIAITGIIVGVKKVNALFSVFSPITARELVGFLKNSNNAVRKEKNGF
jgi:hypothetical protein